MNPSYDTIVALAASLQKALGCLHGLDDVLTNHKLERLSDALESAQTAVTSFMEQAEKVK